MTKVLSPVLSYFGGNKSINTATNQQVQGNQEAQAQLDPYMATGKQANTQLQNALSSGELGGTFNPGDLTKDAGYQFKLAEGQKGLDRRASAGGNYFSGQALKEAQQFGQGLADTTYGDAYNRDLERQKNLYAILSGQQGQGQTAATNYGGYSTNSGTARAQGEIAKQNNKNQAINSLFGTLGGGYF